MPRPNQSMRSTCALALLMVCGCANHSAIERPSVSDLYQQALTTARVTDTAGPVNPKDTHLHLSDLSESEDDVNAQVEIVADDPKINQSVSTGVSVSGIKSVEQAMFATQQSLSPEELPSAAAVPDDAPRITEFFPQTDVREAIDIISEQTGDTVIVDDTVGGVITVQLNEVTFEEALETLLLPLGLVYAKYNGAYLVAPPDPDSPLFSYVATRSHYSPRYHPASKLVELLPPRFQDFYQLSDERNLIVIDAPEAIAEEMVMRLQELDLPVQQVILEAIVCVTAPDSEFRFGMDWNHVVKVDTADQLNLGLNGLAFNGAASGFGLKNAFDDFAVTSAFVQLLSREGYVTIRAAPRVTAKDGEQASISIARETFFSLQPDASNVLFRQDVQKVDAGITLMITPKIRGDMVSVEIERAEVSEDIRTSARSPELSLNPYPIINRRLVSTKVDVRDGHTIVIGGLVQRQTVDRENRVPFMSSIPGLGHFFRNVEKQEQEAEVAIFISPRIVPLDSLQ